LHLKTINFSERLGSASRLSCQSFVKTKRGVADPKNRATLADKK
jgi:hypothetical protein